MKYLIEETTLTGIADAVRGKNGTTDLIPVSNLATEISNLSTGGSAQFEPVKITDMSYIDYNGVRDNFFTTYSNYFKYRNVSNYYQAFYGASNIEDLSGLEIIYRNTETLCPSMWFMFYNCSNLKQLPSIIKSVESTAPIKPSETKGMFQNCYNLQTIPDSWYGIFDFSDVNNARDMFNGCYSLRHMPKNFIKDMNMKWVSTNNIIYYQGFTACYSLDELTKLPLYEGATVSSNMFRYTFDGCGRLSRLVFQMPKVDNVAVPGTANWSNQTIDLREQIGWVSSNNVSYITGYNSGITADKQVSDDATYQALKNDPDWLATDINYSRYNHNSAVETINSLPDTSAYLATNGGTNTIIFSANSGTKTDGGAIGNLTEEEIAVATAKGWTVQLV